MRNTIQRFGAAMFVPVLLFPAAGILLGLTVVLLNPHLFPFAIEGSIYVKIVNVFQKASLVLFQNMPMLFALGLPIALAKRASGRAVLAAFISYLTFNYFIGGILDIWSEQLEINYQVGQTGLTQIGGVLTLDTSIVGSIITAAFTVWIHNRYFDLRLPEWVNVFTGTPLIVIICFPLMLILAILTVLIWPPIQNGIQTLQSFILNSGVIGVWLFTFLERILIPTGLHHFIYGPIYFGPIVTDGGTVNYWISHISEFATSTKTLNELFPQGGFMLIGMGKVFGCAGISMAIYATAKPENKKMVSGLLIGATITAILTGITEPIEFTFIFIAPMLFVVHAFLAASMSTIMYMFGISGNFYLGIIDFIFQNWLPLGANHWEVYAIQIAIGLTFTVIYFFVFKFLIIRFNLMTPGRSDKNIKLFTKSDYKKNKNQKVNKSKTDSVTIDSVTQQAIAFIEGLGGKGNITQLTNCATRLRIKVNKPELVQEVDYFQNHGAINVVYKGQSLQIIVGLTVPQVREEMSTFLK
ncbi:PTS alpha-glucoside transporter subunit IIBC [Gilliamella sp. App2-1]|uniref:alpha-glucoside-specific PTS transporter subunit IIBC n=1 Tax=Gilliamella sp. App2-1 TaxID=3120230 RepID=UPI00082948D9|nr:alpha-glucoside-specific PTS transporter subunit IIBC [Gilliamella apicola]OCG21858.1 PTS alpha-glucoside transporter subunit IIBC [Gilliamella apicola]